MVAEVYNTVLARVVVDYPLIVEDDTVPPPDAIGKLLATFESLKGKGERVAVSGCLCTLAGPEHS